jgi:3-phosphoshikimate 1-carboxyvinyltransferase
LLAGLFAPYAFQSFFTGDASLSKRPMKRLFKPLEQMGVRFNATLGGTPPFSMNGGDLMPINYEMEVASAQVKSAIILAACQIQGITTILEKVRTRNHTENMLQGCGGDISVESTANGDLITINGGKELLPMNITIPNDPSSAAFLIATAVLCEGSGVVVESVCVNGTRTGFFDALIQMGANLEFTNKRTVCGEEIADISAQYSPNLKGIELSGENSASMIDEYPILFVVCAFANGISNIHGLEELTAKESNRLKAMEENLLKIGVQCKANYEDFSIEIIGNPNLNPKCNQKLLTQMDHRIAMSCFIAGLKSESGITIDDDSYIKTSFPNFLDIMTKLNAKFN